MDLENKAVADNGAKMGRPPLKVRPTTVRLTQKTIDEIEAVAGKHRLSVFIREAVERELERRGRGGE